MNKFIGIGALAASMLITAGSAQAVAIFRAVLTHDQEVTTPNPPIPDEGSSGVAIFELNDARTRLTYDVQLTGLDLGRVNAATGITQIGPVAGDTNPNNDAIRMHIHRSPTGSNGAIVFGMFDLAANAATRNDVSPNDLFIDIAGLHITGAWDLTEGAAAFTLATELANGNLFNGGLYINVHTADHAGGEIRGQILQAPEPGSLALFGLGLAGFFGIRRRPATP